MFKSFLRKRNKETSVLNTDRFDKRRFEQIYEMSKGLQQIEEIEEIPLFKELLGDIWASLFKMNPELKDDHEIGDHLQPNKKLIERLMCEKSYLDYHEKTRLDDMLSAIGTIKFGEKTHEWIKEQIQKNQELNKQMQKIQQLLEQINKDKQQEKQQNEQAQDGNNENNKQKDNQKQEEQEQGTQQSESQTEQELNKAMSTFASHLEQVLNNNNKSFSQVIAQAIKDTKDTEKELKSLFGGIQAGSSKSELQKLPLRDKIALAEILSYDSKIKEIAKWTGKFTQIAQTKQKMKYKESTEQSGVEQGDNIEKLLPSELVQYINPKTKLEFLRRFSEKETLQYEQKGKESLGQGSIILCLDQSGSMINMDEQSKGFALALMAIAKKQKRNFAYIPFATIVSGVKEFPKGKIKPNEMIELARNFLDGGTSFKEPLEEALKIIKKDKFKDADIIFITDGKAEVSSHFLNRFNKIKEKEKFHVLSLMIGKTPDKSKLELFSDRVIEVTNFNDEGSFEAFEI